MPTDLFAWKEKAEHYRALATVDGWKDGGR